MKIEFEHKENFEVNLNINLEGASILDCAIASLQLKKIIVQEVGQEQADNIFSSLIGKDQITIPSGLFKKQNNQA